MKSLFYLILFLFIVIVYIHIIYHLKTSNALEVYVIDDCSKEKFEEICNLRQPFVYTFPMEDIDTYCNQNHRYRKKYKKYCTGCSNRPSPR